MSHLQSSQQKSVKKKEEIFVSAEEKKEAEAKASVFVAALERCMFDALVPKCTSLPTVYYYDRFYVKKMI